MKLTSMRQILYLIILCVIGLGAYAQTEPRLVLPVGHTGEISTASFSPDNKYVVTSANDNTTRIWETFTGREVWLAHSRLTAFSPDGRFIVVGSSDSLVSLDKALYILDAKTGLELRPIIGLSDRIRSVFFSADSKKLLTITLDNIIEIWEVESGQRIQKISIKDSLVRSACFSPDGKRILAELSNWSAVILDVESGLEIHCLKGHKSSLSSFGFSPDGSKVLTTAIMDKIALLWDAASGKILHRLSGHSEWINSAIFSTDEKLALTAGYDGTVRIYDIATGIQLKVLTGHIGPVNTAVFSNDCEHVLTAGSDNTARVFDVVTGRELQVLRGHFGKVNSVVFSADYKYALTASDDQTARFWNLENGSEIRVFQGCSREVNSAVFSSDIKSVLCAVNDSTARLFDLHSGNQVQVFRGHLNQVNSAVLSPNGKLALSASNDNTARIFDVSSGKELQILKGHKYSVNSAVFGPDGTSALTASWDGTARLWNTSTGKEIRSYEGHTGSVSSVFMSRDSITVFTTSADNTVRLWDVSSGSERQVHSFNEDNSLEVEALKKDLKEMGIKPREIIKGKLNKSILSQLTSLVISPDGRFVLTSSRTGNTSIYELTSGQELCVLSKKNGIVYSGAFSPDCKQVVTANSDNTSRIWDVSSGKELQVLSGHTSQINSAVFSPDGKHILTTGADHKSILWSAGTGKPLCTLLQLEDNDWLVYDEHYRFDGSPGAIEKLYFVCGLEPIELGQMKDALYVPGLASKILNGEDINYKKLSDLDICGALPIIEKTNESPDGWEFSIEQRRWPIVRLEVMVDGKTVKTIALDQLKFVNAKATLRLTRTELQQHLKPGEESKVTVIAITENDKREFKSRGVQIELEAEGEKQDPNLYMLMIGVNDYKDDALDLRFPVQDALAFGSALESSARKLLGNDKVFVYNVQSKTDNTAVYTTPERAGVMKALEDIGKKAKTNDVLFIFFAGHGVMQGADNTFTFLTADASKLNPVGISTTDLKSWLSPEGPFHMMPNKTVLVYDACNSGQAAKEIMADLAMARDDDATERQRQIEDLGDKQGVFILSASAPNQSAYELPHLGQGMLTYSLLTTLKNNPGVLDEDKNGKGFLNLQKWFLETEREQSRLMQSLGLNQDAQPYGTANIRIGVVDDEVRNGIALMAEKPLVYCSNARDDNDEDPLELKQAVNTYLETATTRGTSSKLGYIKAETTQANIVKLVYNTSGEKVQCRILIFKSKVKMNELNITTTPGKAAEEVVKAVEGAIK